MDFLRSVATSNWRAATISSSVSEFKWSFSALKDSSAWLTKNLRTDMGQLSGGRQLADAQRSWLQDERPAWQA